MSFLQIQEEQKRQENKLERQYAELNERFVQFEQEQRQKEGELQQQAAELELIKQRAEEARRITELNQARYHKPGHRFSPYRSTPYLHGNPSITQMVPLNPHQQEKPHKEWQQLN